MKDLDTKKSVPSWYWQQQRKNPWAHQSHVAVREMEADIGKGHHVVQEMVESLEYQKVCVHWVPHLLTEK